MKINSNFDKRRVRKDTVIKLTKDERLIELINGNERYYYPATIANLHKWKEKRPNLNLWGN